MFDQNWSFLHKKLKVKNITLDERDGLLDSVVYEYKDDGSVRGVKMMHSTMTKWIRLGLDGDTSDKFLKSITFKEKVEIFSFMQKEFMSEGEDKPSNSK